MTKPNSISVSFSLLRVLVLIYVGVFLYARFLSDKGIFHPPPSSYEDSDEILKLRCEDGVAISAIFLPNPRARCTILYSHGNAEDIGEDRPLLEAIRDAGFSVFAYDYHGYGTSAGTPSERNAYRDIDAAYDYLVQQRGTAPERIIALGRSLGGAMAVDLAARRPIGGLVLESAFVSAYRVVTVVPLFPFDKFANLAKIGRVHCPVLVMHGTSDEVIPSWHGKALFRSAPLPKLSLWVEGAGHNNLASVAGDRYGQALRRLAALVDKNAPRTAPPD
jgi:fermentation-respiration switch protein FrsA (DUF1100 family)